MDLLYKLYSTHAPTGSEWPMICLVRDWIAENVPAAEVRMDSWGNLYITKGEQSAGYPVLCCHLD